MGNDSEMSGEERNEWKASFFFNGLSGRSSGFKATPVHLMAKKRNLDTCDSTHSQSSRVKPLVLERSHTASLGLPSAQIAESRKPARATPMSVSFLMVLDVETQCRTLESEHGPHPQTSQEASCLSPSHPQPPQATSCLSYQEVCP